jgi:ribosomal-protein-alanine N-acetyltransferase
MLVTPCVELIPAMLGFVERNEAHLAPWSPPAPAGVRTPEHWQEIVTKSAAAFAAGQALRLWMAAKDQPGRIIGTIGYSQIFRGPFCSCVLGYQIDRDCEGRGLMREALHESIRYMFTEQKLHRIGANYRPENVRSGRLLARLGFRIEGYSKRYLFIDGEWRDHILTSITNDGFEGAWLKQHAPP